MSVYVDSPNWKLGRMKMCHMMADSREELDEMADALSLDRKYFQDTKYPHYDICKSNRTKAIARGAIEVTTRDLIRIAKRPKYEIYEHSWSKPGKDCSVECDVCDNKTLGELIWCCHAFWCKDKEDGGRYCYENHMEQMIGPSYDY